MSLTGHDRSSIKVSMNRLSTAKRAQILGMMVEGMSLRAISRLTGASKNTLAKLLVDAGRAALAFHDKQVRGLQTKRIQADEIWSFVYAKDKNVPAEKRGEGGAGSVWTWTCLDADSKLMVSWFVGGRDAGAAYEVMSDCAERLTKRVQLTTDGHRAYLTAVDDVFGIGIDYAMLVKQYGEATKEEARRYSPAVCLGIDKTVVIGAPDEDHISTSYVERQNLSMRMGMRRFTRLTNAFSKKIENHIHAISIYFLHYNFVRIHQTLRVTPAMEAGCADRLYSLEDMVRIVDEFTATEKAAAEKVTETPEISN